jgi:hypothetical protein
MLLNEKSLVMKKYETVLEEIKNIKFDELIYFHDKVLDKLF